VTGHSQTKKKITFTGGLKDNKNSREKYRKKRKNRETQKLSQLTSTLLEAGQILNPHLHTSKPLPLIPSKPLPLIPE